MSDDVYMNLSFNKVSRADAERILSAVTSTVGLISYSVYIDDPIEDDDDDEKLTPSIFMPMNPHV